MRVAYEMSALAWAGYQNFLENLIKSSGARNILEVGGGANPAISRKFLLEHGLNYTVLDISQTELDKAPEGYLKICENIASPNLNIQGGYDFIFSKMLAEHVMSGEIFHLNVLKLLAPGGTAFHFFPTLYAFPFLVNRLMPEKITRGILSVLQSGRNTEGRHAKFPAYYSYCRGPTTRQIRRLERMGYQVRDYVGFFGHDGYYQKFPRIGRLHKAVSGWLVRHPIPFLTSFAYVTLIKK